MRRIQVNYTCTAVPSERIPFVAKGGIIKVHCDTNGIPTKIYWYRRYIDSKIDGCITLLDDSKAKTKPKKKVLIDE